LVTRKSKRERPVGGRSGPGSVGSTIQGGPPVFADVEVTDDVAVVSAVAEDLSES
jgi:hypothetical protein